MLQSMVQHIHGRPMWVYILVALLHHNKSLRSMVIHIRRSKLNCAAFGICDMLANVQIKHSCCRSNSLDSNCFQSSIGPPLPQDDLIISWTEVRSNASIKSNFLKQTHIAVFSSSILAYDSKQVSWLTARACIALQLQSRTYLTICMI